MQPNVYFVPYIGCRISILNIDKFEALPAKVQAAVKEAFDVMQHSDEEVQEINEALLAEMQVI
jgi:TRAP-type C4-dicarboxylate transport system substrate-binding protein